MWDKGRPRIFAVAWTILVLAGMTACDDDPTSVPGLVTSPAVTAALEEAIQDEYKAENTYLRILADFGPVLPFQNIAFAEERHSQALASLFVRRELDVPLSDWTLSNVPRFSSVAEACIAAANAEVANVAMYDDLLSRDLPADVRTVFENNREASMVRHLPAFERCS